jgi:hypothetical protein
LVERNRVLPVLASTYNRAVYLAEGVNHARRRPAGMQVIMTATPRQVVGGETVHVTWGVTEGTAEFHDWLGLFAENDDKKCLRHVYVKTNKVSSRNPPVESDLRFLRVGNKHTHIHTHTRARAHTHTHTHIHTHTHSVVASGQWRHRERRAGKNSQKSVVSDFI